MKKRIVIEELRQMLLNGCTVQEIATYFQTTKASVNTAMHRNKISMEPFRIERVKKIVEYSEQNGCHMAASYYGLSLGAIYAYRTRYFNRDFKGE